MHVLSGVNPRKPLLMQRHGLQGACGYGTISKDSYPFWSVAALSLTNSFSVAGPAKACGECFEIKCVDVGGPFAVSISHLCAAEAQLRQAECTPGRPFWQRGLVSHTAVARQSHRSACLLAAADLKHAAWWYQAPVCLSEIMQPNDQSLFRNIIRCIAAMQGRCSKDANQRSVTVTITDTCPECGSDHIDMQALTFNKVLAFSGVLQCHLWQQTCITHP